MVRHTKVTKTTKIAVDDEVLYKGEWKKVTSIDKEYLCVAHAFLTLADLIPEWEVETFKDFSDSTPEFSINLINRSKAAVEKSVILFNEKTVPATRYNIEKLTAIANNVKDFMNKEGIVFEEEEVCQ